MRVVVSSNGPGLDSEMDPRFGRCVYFVVVDTDSMEVESHPNEAREAMGGAGIQAAQIVDRLGVKIVLTGNVGPNAYDTLAEAGISIFVGLKGSVKDVVEAYKRGDAKAADSHTNPSRHGGPGKGRGGGMGGGRGGGR